MKKLMLYERFIKRIFDFIIASCSFFLLLPIIIIVMILVRIMLGTPVFFIQERPGKDERIFKLYKFRSMNSKTDDQGALLQDEQRLTNFGKFLRNSSIDELPSLMNIIKGDMSIVGPRPLLVEYLDQYSNEQKSRHNVRPGLTGLAQIKGRNQISWEEKFSYDVQYVKNISFLGDIRIIFYTFFKVLRGSGVNTATGNSMKKYKNKDQDSKGGVG